MAKRKKKKEVAKKFEYSIELYGILLVLVGSSNAVNITDGLDGLAAGLSAIAFLAFGIISFGRKRIIF